MKTESKVNPNWWRELAEYVMQVGDKSDLSYVFGGGKLRIHQGMNYEHWLEFAELLIKQKRHNFELPTETPEEKEALDAIVQVEWKNGDLVEYRNKDKGEGGLLIFVGIHPTHKDHAVLYGKHLASDYISVPLSMLSKPETPEAKKERERLGAVGEMFTYWSDDEGDFVTGDDDDRWVKELLFSLYDAGYKRG